MKMKISNELVQPNGSAGCNGAADCWTKAVTYEIKEW